MVDLDLYSLSGTDTTTDTITPDWAIRVPQSRFLEVREHARVDESPDDWSSTWSLSRHIRIQAAVDVALGRQGYDRDRTTVPESAIRQAAVHAVEIVRSVERLASEHGATNDNYPMYESKGQVVVILQGGRHRQCNVCNVWNSNKQRWCDGCRKRTYCDRHCQKADWAVHKPWCWAVQELRAVPKAVARRDRQRERPQERLQRQRQLLQRLIYERE